ncbi:MAG: hypothetical protein E7G91_04655, partial [Serratia liquefaciens]|nr:hypothetical protein [Serratia liquefaciens]
TPPFSAKYPHHFLTRLNKPAFLFAAADSPDNSGFKPESHAKEPFINISINIKFSFRYFSAKHKCLALVFSRQYVA